MKEFDLLLYSLENIVKENLYCEDNMLRIKSKLKYDIIKKLKPSWRDELEITDALQMLMDEGNKIEYDIVTGWWKDTGTPEDILHANSLILDSIGKDNQFVISADAKIQENVVIGKNSTISRDSFVKGPTIIGENCEIGPSARIGPHVSIGDNSKIKNCDIENSILMENTSISSKIHIKDSIIATGSKIEDNKEPKKHQFLLGERSQVKL